METLYAALIFAWPAIKIGLLILAGLAAFVAVAALATLIGFITLQQICKWYFGVDITELPSQSQTQPAPQNPSQTEAAKDDTPPSPTNVNPWEPGSLGHIKAVHNLLVETSERLWLFEGAMRHNGLLPEEVPIITWVKCPAGAHRKLAFSDIPWEDRINTQRQQAQEEEKTMSA